MAEQKLMIINTTVTSTFSAAMSALRALVLGWGCSRARWRGLGVATPRRSDGWAGGEP